MCVIRMTIHISYTTAQLKFNDNEILSVWAFRNNLLFSSCSLRLLLFLKVLETVKKITFQTFIVTRCSIHYVSYIECLGKKEQAAKNYSR